MSAAASWQTGPVDPDDPRRENLRPGGKSLTGGRVHSPVIQLRVSEDLRDWYAEQADAAGVGLSKYVRQVLEAHRAEVEEGGRDAS